MTGDDVRTVKFREKMRGYHRQDAGRLLNGAHARPSEQRFLAQFKGPLKPSGRNVPTVKAGTEVLLMAVGSSSAAGFRVPKRRRRTEEAGDRVRHWSGGTRPVLTLNQHVENLPDPKTKIRCWI
jgi:hypothetical protein